MKPIDLKISPEKPTLSEPLKGYYPTFRIESSSDYEFPKSGSMTIDFKKIGEESRTDSDGKERNSCTIEVHRITAVNNSASDKVDTKDMDKEDESDDYETPKERKSYEKSSNMEQFDKKRATRKPKSMY
jgi:hypothetical protein